MWCTLLASTSTRCRTGANKFLQAHTNTHKINKEIFTNYSHNEITLIYLSAHMYVQSLETSNIVYPYVCYFGKLFTTGSLCTIILFKMTILCAHLCSLCVCLCHASFRLSLSLTLFSLPTSGNLEWIVFSYQTAALL